MGGLGAVVEIDETFIGTKEGAEVKRGFRHKNAILTLVERGGNARSFYVDGTSAKDLLPIIRANEHPDSIVMTDEAVQYTRLSKHFTAHGTTNHDRVRFGVDDAARTQNALAGIIGKRLTNRFVNSGVSKSIQAARMAAAGVQL